MTDFFASQLKMAGTALLLSILSLVIGLIIIALQGKIGGLAASFRGPAGMGETASALSTLEKANTPMLILQVIGFGILAAMLTKAGETSIANISFGLFILAGVILVFRGTFDGSLTVRAARDFASTGSIPEYYEPLREWVHHAFEIGYVTFFIAMAGFGWGILRTDLLSPWVGWVSAGWSVLWVVGYFFRVGLPIFIVLPPLLYGIGLLLYSKI